MSEFGLIFTREVCMDGGMKELDQTPDYISKQVDMSRLFFLDASEAGKFSVACGGFERCRPDYRIDRPGLPWYCLEFVNRGEGTLQLHDQQHALKPGSFFVYGPRMAHRIESSADNPLVKYFVAFHGSQVDDFLMANDIALGGVAHCHRADSVRSSFNLLIERGIRKSKLSGVLCSLTVQQLLLLCRDDSAGAIDTDSPAYQTYSRARDHIERNYLQLTSLESAAKGSGVEAAYLCRLFSRYHDESPYQFLIRLRMDHASQLLLEEGANVRTVAKSMGYKDPFHFSRVFKSVHRIAPSRFRTSLYT